MANEHYGTWKVNRFKGKVIAQDAEIDTTVEWPLCKLIIFESAFFILAKWIGISAKPIQNSSLKEEEATHCKIY